MESLRWAAGEIIVLQVEGNVDLYTLLSLRAALDEGLDRFPAHLVVDLGRMTFASELCAGMVLAPFGTVSQHGSSRDRHPGVTAEDKQRKTWPI
jgi:anti-anti-sigma regulatory factor